MDECESYPCHGHHNVCVNTPGSYRCECISGYRKINGFCKGIEICKKKTSNVLQSFNKLIECAMSNLMFVFIYTDVDECQDSSICSHKCINSDGSYKCDCNQGFKLENDKDCVDVNECLDTKCHDCENLPGSFKCFCKKGFVIDPATQECNSMKRLLLFN